MARAARPRRAAASSCRAASSRSATRRRSSSSAFIPQFIDPRGEIGAQITLLGVTAMVFAAIADGGWAVLSGGAAKVLTRARLRWLTRISGGVLIGGGIWLTFSRSR
jgi:threonine/homoserine/homoserine lactone efflux protein